MVQIGVERQDCYCRDRHDRIVTSWQNSSGQYVRRALECVCLFVIVCLYLSACICMFVFLFVCLRSCVCLCVGARVNWQHMEQLSRFKSLVRPCGAIFCSEAGHYVGLIGNGHWRDELCVIVTSVPKDYFSAWVFQKNTFFFGNSYCTKFILGLGANRN